MTKKTQLIFRIVVEVILTIGMAIDGNFWAAAGWGMLSFTNMDILIEMVAKEKQNQPPKSN